jgi:uncharacterized phage-associated protein
MRPSASGARVDAKDVAAYIVRRVGTVSAMKLQKLVYYSQAWALAWTDRPLFHNRIEAWANGPVVRDLYATHRGEFEISSVPGDEAALDEQARAVVDSVLEAYGRQSPQTLSDQTHSEAPWLEARRGAPPGARCENEISQRAMRAYYRSLND